MPNPCANVKCVYRKSAVDELRKNKWRPLRQPDISKLPQSRRPKN